MSRRLNWMQDATGGKQDFAMHCENFARIAKISQP